MIFKLLKFLVKPLLFLWILNMAFGLFFAGSVFFNTIDNLNFGFGDLFFSSNSTENMNVLKSELIINASAKGSEIGKTMIDSWNKSYIAQKADRLNPVNPSPRYQGEPKDVINQYFKDIEIQNTQTLNEALEQMDNNN